MPSNIVVDRTFVDAATGTRWLVDYKTSHPEADEALNAFLAREEVAYREQLTNYAAALRALWGESVTAALYFPGLQYLHTVDVAG